MLCDNLGRNSYCYKIIRDIFIYDNLTMPLAPYIKTSSAFITLYTFYIVKGSGKIIVDSTFAIDTLPRNKNNP